jgi:Tim10/DDP family zinc finger
MDQLNQLTPEQRQAVMYQAQQEANQTIMQEMVKQMVAGCFKKCTGQSVSQFFFF